MFIHDAILESVVCGDMQVSASNLRTVLRKMEAKNPNAHKSPLQEQFEVCVSMCILTIMIDHFKMKELLQITQDYRVLHNASLYPVISKQSLNNATIIPKHPTSQ